MTHEGAVKTGPEGAPVIEIEGDIFDAPENAVLIHAVNCQGAWGSGIAEAFKSKYPAAFEVYKSHCKENSELPGTCLLIPPQIEVYRPSLQGEDESGVRPKRRKVNEGQSTKKHWIGCLFTSYGYGKATKFKPGKDSPGKILRNTKMALEDFAKQLEVLDARQFRSAGAEDTQSKGHETSGKGADNDRLVRAGEAKHDARPDVRLGPIYACKFNSGSFGVEWKDTRAVIEEVLHGSTIVILVLSPPSKRK